MPWLEKNQKCQDTGKDNRLSYWSVAFEFLPASQPEWACSESPPHSCYLSALMRFGFIAPTMFWSLCNVNLAVQGGRSSQHPSSKLNSSTFLSPEKIQALFPKRQQLMSLDWHWFQNSKEGSGIYHTLLLTAARCRCRAEVCSSWLLMSSVVEWLL